MLLQNLNMAERKPIRTLFTIIAVAATLFGLGWTMLANHPRPGLSLMAGGIAYLLYELFDCEPVKNNIPGPLRFVFATLLICCTIAVCARSIEELVLGTSIPAQKKATDVSKQSLPLSQSDGHPGGSDAPPSSQPSHPKQDHDNNAPIEIIAHPYDVTSERHKEFIKALKPASDETDALRVGCLSGSDSACVAAGQFLMLLSEAGWKIDSDKVFKMEAQIPVSGVALATKPQQPRPPNLPPHLGVWQPEDKSQMRIQKAFTQMSIPVHPVAGNDLPDGTLGVYFGPDPGPQTVRLYMVLSECKPSAESCDLLSETTRTSGAFLTTGSDRQVIHVDRPKSAYFEVEASDKQFTVKRSELPRTVRLGRCVDHPCTIKILRFTQNEIIIDSRSATSWDEGNGKMASVLIHWKLVGE